MKICCIVLVYNELEYTIKTFKSLHQQKNEQFNFDIICVDNASDKKYAIPLQEYCSKESIRYIRHEVNDGYAGGNNFAFEIARNEGYELVFIANNDIELMNNEIMEKMVNSFNIDERIALVGTHLVDTEGNKNRVPRISAAITKLEKINEYENETFISVPFVTGCFFVVRTSCIKNQDLFDYSYFMYSEEQNLEFQLMHEGYYVGILKDSDCVVKHYGGFFDFNTQSRWSIYLSARNFVLSMRDFSLKVRLFFYFSYFLILLRKAISCRKISILSGYFSGIRLIIKKASKKFVYEDAITHVKKIGGKNR